MTDRVLEVRRRASFGTGIGATDTAALLTLLDTARQERDAAQADPLSLCACNHCRRLGRGTVMLYKDQECPTCAALEVDDAERAAVAELGARAAGAEQRAKRALAEVERLALEFATAVGCAEGFQRERDEALDTIKALSESLPQWRTSQDAILEERCPMHAREAYEKATKQSD